MGILSIIMLLSTLICGWWIRSTGEGDIHFHMQLGIWTVVVTCITIVFFFIKR
ncbi:hypothetical protein CS063_13065 [Sporanaerobium hydrogeniformans]|uniref:Uncharacterized protein n=2 Tax=Sporanaerobium hydrogeniformans TaxID=3072179 RepID=A0AC61DA72_9FIRM|nr:hypothetical protein CS063_13065 [Sporanaerobium hydrogeniformans]